MKKDIARLTTRWCSTGLVVTWEVIIYTDLNTTNDKGITLKWSLDRSSAANEVRAFGNIFLCTFSASYGLKHIKICVTGDWNVDRKRSNNCILTDFEKLLYRSQSFAQTNFYSYIENIFSKFNHQKLNPFEGLAHGEN